jgi:hypothetical protein
MIARRRWSALLGAHLVRITTVAPLVGEPLGKVFLLWLFPGQFTGTFDETLRRWFALNVR